jgi:glycosyltransferase involved in cell wall biosynthesis
MSLPKVSLVCPTFNRQHFLPTAIRCFMQQTYKPIELIIVDDSDDSSWARDLSIPFVHIRLNERTPTGTKRNIGADYAMGDIVANLDDDDWSMAHRIETQVMHLENSQKAMTGYNQTISYDEKTKNFYRNQGGPPYLASGTSQMYWKSWWKEHPYPDVTYGEDSVFARTARLLDQLVIVEPGKMMIARKHVNNTDPVHVKWLKKMDPSEIHTDFFRAIDGMPNFGVDYLYEKHICFGECSQELERDRNALVVDFKTKWIPEIKTR